MVASVARLFVLFMLIFGGGLYSPFCVSAEASDSGFLLIVAFDNQGVRENVEFTVAGLTYRTNAAGYASIQLKPGEYTVAFTQAKKIVSARVLAGEETQISISQSTENAKNTKVEATTPVGLELRAASVNTLSLADLNKEASQSSETQEEVVVIAPRIRGSTSALLEARRKSTAVSDVMGSEQMARQGDSDAATSLRRITGLTLMNGRFVYVRGLGERYSNVQMNGFTLPSPEPSRRVVPLDLFPTSVLDSVVVQKSYSSNMPGEFGGGAIQLQTRTIPDHPFVQMNINQNFDNFQNRLTYQGGKNDWLGNDDGSRAMPHAIRDVLASGQKLTVRQPGSNEGISSEQLTELGRSLPNRYATSRTSSPPPPGFSVAGGRKFKIAGSHLGLSSSILYGQNANRLERQSRNLNAVGAGGPYVIDTEQKSEISEVETRVAGHIETQLEFNKNNNLQLSTFLLRHTTDFVNQEERRDPNSISTVESTTLDWTERQLWTRHLKGQHNLNAAVSWPVVVNWRAGSSLANRDSPDRRDYAFERTPQLYQMRSDSGGNRRTYSELSDTATEVGADLTVPIITKDNKLTVKFGATQVERKRRSDVFRLYFVGTPGSEPIESQLAPQNIRPDGFILQNLTDAADSYSGQQGLSSQYVSVDYNPSPRWTAQIGARREQSVQRVKTFKYYEPNLPFSESELTMRNVLPSSSLTYAPTSRWKGRLAYSETIARPDFRELSEVGFIDDETGNDVRGNSALKGTVIQNIDHRWEYNWTNEDYVSFGGFFKRFRDPIEVMFVPGVNRIQSFDNAKAANNVGIELESRTGLRHFTRSARRWTFVTNLTLIRSQIELDERNRGLQTSESRPLQGQSPYVLNLQLQYDRPLWGLSSTLLYNVIGPRITEVGTNDIPDTYEQPFQQLDFVLTKKISRSISAGVRARNLLDPVLESKQADQVVRQLRLGRTYGVNLNATF